MGYSKEYLAYLNSPTWQKRRRAALQRARYQCERCSEKSGLQVHHTTYAHLGNEQPSELIVLCAGCHYLEDKKRKDGNGRSRASILKNRGGYAKSKKRRKRRKRK